MTASISPGMEKSFAQVAEMISTARQKALKAARSYPELMGELDWPEQFAGTLHERLVQHVQALLMRFAGFCFIES